MAQRDAASLHHIYTSCIPKRISDENSLTAFRLIKSTNVINQTAHAQRRVLANGIRTGVVYVVPHPLVRTVHSIEHVD